MDGDARPEEPDAAAGPTEEDVRLRDKLARDRSMIEHGRRIGGLPGAMMAGAMIALRDIYEPPRDDQPVAEVESSSEPHDVDRDGVRLAAADVASTHDVAVAAQPRRAPILSPARRRSRSRRAR